MNCMYCKQFVTQSSDRDEGWKYLWWACARCRAYVEYTGKLANYDELAAVRIDCKRRDTNYTVLVDYVEGVTKVTPFEETEDGFLMGIGVTSIIIPAILRDLTPANVAQKLSTLINFS